MQIHEQNLYKNITFTQKDETHVNEKIYDAFPCLRTTGWAAYKAKNTSELSDFPYDPSGKKDMEYLRKYEN